MVDLDVPVEAAFAKWQALDTLASFLVGVDNVEVVDAGEKRLHWTGGDQTARREWDVVVTDEPNERFEWVALGAAKNHGVIRFTPLGDGRTRLRATVHSDDGRIRLDPDRVKDLIEAG